MAVATPHCSMQPRAPPRHPPVPPHLSPPPRQRNRARTPGIAAAVAVSPAGTQARRRRFRRRLSASGPDDLPGGPLVSQGSGRTFFPLFSHAGAPSPVGHRWRQRAGRAGGCPADQANVACHVGHGPQWSETVGHLDPGAKSPARLF
jgi:hypothetical protein